MFNQMPNVLYFHRLVLLCNDNSFRGKPIFCFSRENSGFWFNFSGARGLIDDTIKFTSSTIRTGVAIRPLAEMARTKDACLDFHFLNAPRITRTSLTTREELFTLPYSALLAVLSKFRSRSGWLEINSFSCSTYWIPFLSFRIWKGDSAFSFVPVYV